MPTLPLLRALLFPAIALTSVWWLAPLIGLWTEDYQTLISVLPYLLGTLLLVLAQVFNQGRLGQMALLVMATYALIQFELQASLEHSERWWVFFWLTLLWPLNAVVVRFLPERRPLSLAGMMFPLALALQLLLIYGLTLTSLYPAVLQWSESFRAAGVGGLLPLPAWLSFSIAVALCANRLPRKADIPLAFITVIVLHAGMFYLFASQQVSALTASTSLLLLFATLLVSNHQLAFIDELTGLPGRRALMNDLKHRHGRYILVMADIDHFKKFNDTHGHDVGDDVLRLVAAQLEKTSGGGRAYRYGGEEFTLLFPSAELVETRPFIEATRERIASYQLTLRDTNQRPASSKDGKKQRGQKSKARTLNVTMSFGAARRESGESIEALMKRADNALYKAKQNGRNRVEDAV